MITFSVKSEFLWHSYIRIKYLLRKNKNLFFWKQFIVHKALFLFNFFQILSPNIFHTLQDSMIVSIRDRCCYGFTAQNFTKIKQFTGLFHRQFYSPHTLSHQFYHPQNWHPLYWWFCLAQIHICLNFHLDIHRKNKIFKIFRCNILNSSLGCFLISAWWSPETTLYTQFGLSRCFCSKCSFTCSTSLKKNFLWWYFFGEVLLPQNCS